MANRNLKFFLLMLAASLMLIRCGGETRRRTDPVCDYVDCSAAFRIVEFSPTYQEQNVQRSAPIIFLFSQSIDPNSVYGSMSIIESVTGQASQDISATGTFSVDRRNITNDMVIWNPDPSRLLITGARYQVTLKSSLRSATGLSIAPFTYLFTTGTFGGDGSISIPGAPKMFNMNLMKYPYPGVCLAVRITTNEDLADVPQFYFEYKDAFSSIYASGSIYDAEPELLGNGRVWIANFPDLGCDAISSAYKIFFKTTFAVDLDGEMMFLDGTTYREWKYPGDF